MLFVILAGLSVPAWAGDTAKDVNPDEIIRKFAAKEAEFARAREIAFALRDLEFLPCLVEVFLELLHALQRLFLFRPAGGQRARFFFQLGKFSQGVFIDRSNVGAMTRSLAEKSLVVSRNEPRRFWSTVQLAEYLYRWNILEKGLDQSQKLLLNEKDRRAIVLRFYEKKTLDEVGIALGTNGVAAKKRVQRALEKLRHHFVKHGAISSAPRPASMRKSG